MSESIAWRESAACHGADPDLFFPLTEAGPQTTEARLICHACPVCSTCLAWSLKHGVTDGIWGGSTEVERRRLRRDVLIPRQRREPA